MGARVGFLYLSLAVVFAATKYVIHMSDQHYDQHYQEGAPVNCIEDVVDTRCCRNSSVPVSPLLGAAKYGEYTCDTPSTLVEETLIWMQDWLAKDPVGQQVDFLVWTGDDPGHNDVSQSPEFNLQALVALTNWYKKYLPQIRVFPAFGNHDAYPCDELDPNLSDWLFVPAAGNWSDWIPDPNAQATLKKGGYYTVLVTPGFRIISLETTWYDDRNHFIEGMEDVQGMNSWLNATLASARAAGEKVWIIGHIYPGSMREVDTLNYQATAYEYQDIITGHLYGHSHHDHFRLLHQNSDTGPSSTTSGVVYVAPALMPDSQDPGWRVYAYDNVTFEITDVLTYHGSLPIINAQNKVSYNLTYSARDAYDMPDVSSKSWWSLIDRMETDDALFQKFAGYQDQGVYDQSCTGICKSSTLCDLRYVAGADVSACNSGTASGSS